MADIIISTGVKAIAGGIGLVSESIHAHKEKKRHQASIKVSENSTARSTSTSRSSSPPSYTEFQQKTGDEAQWSLDDAQSTLITQPHQDEHTDEKDKPKNVAEMITFFIIEHPLTHPVSPLPLPVILPQRRPHSRSRGFIRAYAPLLQESGVSATCFGEYLDLFDRASMASPWLNAINLAGLAFSFLPAGISMAIGVAIALSVKVATEMQGRERTNTFLDRINEEFFRPRGLYCLIMTWNPDSGDSCSSVDVTSAVEHTDIHTDSRLQNIRNKYRSSDGNTYGDLSELEVAPLVFPGLDALGENDTDEAKGFKEKLKVKHNFVDEYWDKRARAHYKARHPDSVLSQGQEKEVFHSRFADPNNPASSGNLFSLLSGGHINPPSFGSRRGFGRGFDRFDRFGGGYDRWDRFGGGYSRWDAIEQRRQMGYGGRGGFEGLADRVGWESHPENYSQTHTPQQIQLDQERMGLSNGPYQRGIALPFLKNGVKKLFGKNVLYMMIVSLPSDEELARATAQFEAAETEARKHF